MDQFAESEMSHFLLIPQIVVDELESLYYEPVYYHRASHTFFKNTRFFSSKERLRQDILYLLLIVIICRPYFDMHSWVEIRLPAYFIVQLLSPDIIAAL